MDYEKEKKNLMAYDVEMEDNIMDWIEELVGEEIDYFYECLKSGRILCKMLNAIKPGTVPHINPPGNHLVERENIKYFLRACQVFGVSSYDIFDIQDLYTNANPKAVMQTLISLSRGLSNLSWYKGPLCVITKVKNRRMTHEESMRNVVSVSDVLGTIEEKGNEHRGSSDVETDYSEEDDDPSGSTRAIRDPEQEPFLTRLSTDNFNDEHSEEHKVRRTSFASSLVAKGPKALFLYALALFLCGSGHFTEIWIRDFAYLGSCSNATPSSPCIRDVLLEIGYIVYFVGFMISGLVYFFLGPKFTASVGLLMKAVGSMFLSGDFGYGDVFLYVGYYCFTFGGPLLLTSTTHVFYRYFKKNPHFKISLLLCFVASYLNGGHWIFFILSQVKDQVPIHIFFNIYAGILFLLSLITFVTWPTYAQIRIYSLQKQKNVFGGSSVGRFFRSFNWNFAFLCLFFPLAYLPWRLYLDDIFDPSSAAYLSPAYAIAVLLSVGSVFSILIPQLTRFFGYNAYINYSLLALWIIPETALHVAPSQIACWVRAFALGVCLPYLFGFLFHFLLDREGPFFGLKLSIVAGLCGGLEVAAYFLRPNSYFNENIRWYLHLVMAGLFGFFFLLPLAFWVRNRRQNL
uniref:Calponin-homology (CH) domain-containing protein n=1 Tax=Arcella intermedia TaxID=1963864 RepID=A0A6B2KZU2_9EUKA